MPRRISFGLLLLLGLGAYWAVANPPMPAMSCPCDHAEPDSLDARVCSLCRTAEEQSEPVYFLKDINPAKPNRYLALPRLHGNGVQAIGELDAEEREAVWTAAIARAEELFGPRWGLAHNGQFFRTQCHAHIHMGPLSPDVKDEGGTLYAHPRDFPAVGVSQGIWLHPKDGRYCVHLDRDLAEVVLIR
jgi:diadenosine tetraphosphate (Ap4A) HIT family hydrolase